jgi:hypothetical protein
MRNKAWILLFICASFAFAGKKTKCVIVDTGQSKCYNNQGKIDYPKRGQAFFGQDAEYVGNKAAYKDNGDGTITDLNTGLMWSKAVDKRKVSLKEAEIIAKQMTLAEYSDWRTPNIKELYSLIDFRGNTGFNGRNMQSIPSNAIPFINTDYFDFEYGDINSGERYIDAQWLTNTKYTSLTMGGMETLFGVNFADGRIKGYGYKKPGKSRVIKKFYARYVRGNPDYGKNSFVDNGDGTVTDKITGLMWMKNDSQKPMSWKNALKYAEKLKQAGYNDWRLPNAKELQYIVDYSRSPDNSDSPAISPEFKCSQIKNEAGKKDYPFYWTSTTHLDGPSPGNAAAYIAFGRALGQMRGRTMDVHGAGAQRSDPKTGKAMLGHGPQGDAVRVLNYVRCVRGGRAKLISKEPKEEKNKYPFKIKNTGNHDSKRHNNERSNPNGSDFVRRLDRNGDGKVSRKEFDGPKNRFSDHDRNGDGYLTEDEAPPLPRHRR